MCSAVGQTQTRTQAQAQAQAPASNPYSNPRKFARQFDPDLRKGVQFNAAMLNQVQGKGGIEALVVGAVSASRIAKAQAEQDRRRALEKLYADQAAAAQQQVAQMQQQAIQAQETMAAQRVQQTQEVATLREQQAQRVGGIRAAGQAASQSLRILSQSGGQQGPTAASTGRVPVAGGARRTAASLRMGATSRGPGSGANVSV